MRDLTGSTTGRYAIAMLAVVVALALGGSLVPILGSFFPFAVLLLAVLASAWFGGLGPAVLTTILGAAGSFAFITPPLESQTEQIRWAVGYAVFLSVGSGIAFLGGRVRQAFSDAKTAAFERGRQESQVHDRSRQLQFVADSVPVLIAHCDRDLRFKFVNRPYARRFGKEPAEIVGKTIPEVLGSEAAAVLAPHIDKVLRGERVEYEAEVPYRDLGTQYMHCAYEPELDSNGAVVGWVASIQNVTERKRSEERLRMTLSRLGLAMESARLGDWSWDAESERVELSPRAAEVFGLACQRPTTWQDLLQLLPEDDRARARQSIARAVAAGNRCQLESRVNRPDGTQVWASLSGQTYYAATGKPLGMYGVVQDVTARRIAEDRLKEESRENARLYREVRQANKRQEEFISLLAHELRNPLAPIRNGIQILKLTEGRGSTTTPALEMMERQVQHLVRLLDDLVDVSRVMRSSVELRRETISLADVVARAVETCLPGMEAEGHQFTVDAPDEPMWVDGDLVRLAQVVANLLNNAVRYTPAGGRIALSLKRECGEASLRVKDSGIGIEGEMLPKIWEMFVQADRSTRSAQVGMGIGLTLVRSLVEMHGGSVHATSDGLGRGSEFEVRIPLVSAPKRDEIQSEFSPPSSTLDVLVVDDNVDAAQSLALLLDLEGHRTRIANDGPSAIRIALESPPEFAFLDIGMPGMDGYELARRFRDEPTLKNVRLVALTGWGQAEDRRKSSDAGFDAHEVKPIEPQAIARVFGELR